MILLSGELDPEDDFWLVIRITLRAGDFLGTTLGVVAPKAGKSSLGSWLTTAGGGIGALDDEPALTTWALAFVTNVLFSPHKGL